MKNLKISIIIFSIFFGNVFASSELQQQVVEGSASDCARMARAAIYEIAAIFGHNPNVDNFEGYMAAYHLLYEGCYNSL